MSKLASTSRPKTRVAMSRAARRTKPRFRLRPLALALLLAGGTPWALHQGAADARAQTLPNGLNVVQGQATVAVTGNRMTVTNSANALLNWQTFSVGAGSAVRFEQPHAGSQVLNRVIGNDPSNILGSISSNAKVWLLNPHGVLFGRDARVDVAALVTSTLSISDADWQAQRLTLWASNLPGAERAAVVNQGELRTSTGGRVLLLGGAGGVRNEGLIEAPGGQVMLAAGHSVDLVDAGLPNLAVRIQAPQGEAMNLGTLSAAGGTLDLQAAIVNQQGVVRADSIGGAGGTVVLRAADALTASAASLTSANGATGGQVSVDAGAGTALLSGRIEARGESSDGGTVTLLGHQVGLLDGAVVDASGPLRGGGVLVGGSLQGRESRVHNSQAVYMGAGASIHADATKQGDGGRIILWSDKATRVFGQLSARGGRLGGDGGFIETSGGWLDARPASVRAGAPAGRAGQWLLDPNDITIGESSEGPDTINVTGGPNFTSTSDSAFVGTNTIRNALNAGNNVSITTASGAPNSQPGNITMNGASIDVAPNVPVTLTLTADRHVDIVDSAITTSGAPLGLTVRAAKSGTGAVLVSNSTVTTAGGDIDLGGLATAVGPTATAPFAGAVRGANDESGYGIQISDATSLDAGAGRVTMRGASLASSVDAYGVYVSASSSISAGAIDIKGWVNSAGSSVGVSTLSPPDPAGKFTDRVGVAVRGSLTASGPLRVEGTAISPVFYADSSVGGVDISGSVTLNASAPSNPMLSVSGLVSDEATNWSTWRVRAGVYLFPTAVLGATNGADMTVTGQNTTGNRDYYGIYSDSSAIDAAGARNLLIQSPNGTVALEGNGDGSGTIVAPASGNPWGTTRLDIRSSDLRIDGLAISGSPDQASLGSSGGSLEVTRYADLSFTGPTQLRLQSSYIGIGGGEDATRISTNNGSIQLLADTLDIFSGSVNTNASGNALIVAGDSSPNTFAFTNFSGSGALAAPNGRWLIYADAPSAVDAGGLVHAFRQYNAPYGSSLPAAGGNGLMFQLAPTLTGTAGVPITKAYDGTTNVLPANAPLQLQGLVDGDIAIGGLTYGSLAYVDKNVGIGKSMVLAGTGPQIVDIDGKAAYGYRLDPVSIRGDITPKFVTLSGGGAASKVYDGNTTATLTGGTLAGLVGNETLSLTGSGQFTDPNAGTGKTVTVTATGVTLADGANGGLAGNYTLAGGAFTTTADITRKSVALSGVGAASKVYDGNTTAALTGGTLAGLVGAETLSLTGSGQFTDANAGTAKTVTVTVTLADGANGGLAGNYTMDGGSVTTTADITRKSVTLSGVGAASKVYDGNTMTMLTGGTLAGLMGNETLSLTGSGQFADPNAGSAKTVTGTVTLADGANGGLADNYTLDGGAVTATADITRKSVTLSGVGAADKVYDGSAAATLTGGTLAGLVGAETLNLTGSGQFADANAGTAKPVTGTVTLADGANGGLAGNYALASGAIAAAANILPRDLSVIAATAADKIYDGTVTATVTGWSLAGVLAGEQVSVAAGSGVFSGPGVGRGKTVTATVTALGGIGASNYRLGQPVGTALASIDPALLSYVANAAVRVEGQSIAGLAGRVTGFVGSDTQQGATTGTLQFSAVASPKSPVGSYAVTGSGLAAVNYTFTQAASNATALTIAPAPSVTQPAVSTRTIDLQAPATTPASGRTLDVFQALNLDLSGAAAFGSLNVGAMPREQLATVLSARDQYKQSLFAQATRLLEADPTLADVPPCTSVQQLNMGICLITEELKAQLRVPAVAESSAGTPAPSPSPSPVAVAAAAAAAAPSPAPAAAQAPVVPAPPTGVAPAPAPRAPAVDGAPTVAVNLPAARAVLNAALPQIQRKIAVMIGTDNYNDSRIPKLDSARADADAVARVLGNELGYETAVIRDGTRESILATLNRLALQVGANDSVVIYYAGHGQLVEKTGIGYWQPANADAARPETWISNNDINKILAQLGASQVALISDSCFSGSLVADERIRASGQTTDPRTLLGRRAAVVMSSGGNEPVSDSGKNGHSSFAWNLMRSLEKVSSWRAGSNVFEQVRFAVARELPQRPSYGPARQAGHEPGSDYLFEQRRLVNP